MAGVLRPGEARDEEREADLHEQHEEAGHEQPREVDGDAQVTGLVGQRVDALLRERHLALAGGRQVVADVPGLRTAGIGVVLVEHADDDQDDQRQQAHRDELLPSGHPSSSFVQRGPRAEVTLERTYGGSESFALRRGHREVTEVWMVTVWNMSIPTGGFTSLTAA